MKPTEEPKAKSSAEVHMTTEQLNIEAHLEELFRVAKGIGGCGIPLG